MMNGVLVFWYSGVLVFWYFGVLVWATLCTPGAAILIAVAIVHLVHG
jgi:hypothetical protein